SPWQIVICSSKTHMSSRAKASPPLVHSPRRNRNSERDRLLLRAELGGVGDADEALAERGAVQRAGIERRGFDVAGGVDAEFHGDLGAAVDLFDVLEEARLDRRSVLLNGAREGNGIRLSGGACGYRGGLRDGRIGRRLGW